MKSPDPNCVVKVGGGRGFIIVNRIHLPPRPDWKKYIDERLIATAAHCLPQLPNPDHHTDVWERTYKGLLGTLDGTKKDVWADCRFVDPVADVAILGCPDDQELPEQADAYCSLTDEAPFVRISKPMGGTGWVLSLDGKWVRSDIKTHIGIYGASLSNDLSDAGMSGSPILDRFGRAIGLISTGNVSDGRSCKQQGPHPILVRSLPGWMLGKLTSDKNKGRKS
jgi:hypothetical protein